MKEKMSDILFVVACFGLPVLPVLLFLLGSAATGWELHVLSFLREIYILYYGEKGILTVRIGNAVGISIIKVKTFRAVTGSLLFARKLHAILWREISAK